MKLMEDTLELVKEMTDDDEEENIREPLRQYYTVEYDIFRDLMKFKKNIISDYVGSCNGVFIAWEEVLKRISNHLAVLPRDVIKHFYQRYYEEEN